MAKSDELEKLREHVFTQLKAAGYPVDAWQAQYEAEIAANPLARARPFTTLPKPKFGAITKLRPGFTETIKHPRHGAPVGRCQAYKKHTNRTLQCSGFAMKGNHLCHKHGGAKGSGQQTLEGRNNQRAAVTQHGRETRLKRALRSDALRDLREIEREAKALGIMNVLGSRGQYFKTNRVGKPMAHLTKIKKKHNS